MPLKRIIAEFACDAAALASLLREYPAQFVRIALTLSAFPLFELRQIMSTNASRLCFLSLLPAGLISLGLLAAPAFAFDPAQQPASVPSSAPPVAPQLDAGQEIKPDKPGALIKDNTPTGTKLTERKVGGKVTEVEVKKGKNTYYVKPNDPDARGIRGAQWKVGEFGGPKTKTDASASAATSASADSASGPKTVRKSTYKAKASAPVNASGPDSLALPAASTPLETK